MKKPILLTIMVSALVLSLLPRVAHAQNISTYAGCGIGDDSLGGNAEILLPMNTAIDTVGNVYVADYLNNRVRLINTSGVISTFAGSGVYGYSGDGGPATAAALRYPWGLAVDKVGNVYIADHYNSVIRMVNTAGTISTVAGTGSAGYSSDGGAAISSKLNYPSDVVVDTAGNIYIADEYNARVRRVNTSGIITTIAGNGTAGLSGIGGPATAASINYPYRLAIDYKYGRLYIADVGNYQVYKLDMTGNLTDYAGSGTYGFSGDGGPATVAFLTNPCGLATDTAGNLYISDHNATRIRMVGAATGNINTVYGTGTPGYSGDGGPATAADLSGPQGIKIDKYGNLIIADYYNNRVREVNTSGVISTIGGRNGLFQEGYPAVNSELSPMENIATDAAGNLYVADVYNQRVRKVNATTGEMTTVAGGGISGGENAYSGDGNPATDAHLYFPTAMAFDQLGNLYICDQDNQRVRMVNTSGTITTIAGNGTAGFAGDGGAATLAELHFPTGVVVDKTGDVYICDNNNFRIRKVNTLGIISTVAGNGTAGYSGDGGAATNAEIAYASDVALDGMGNLYIADGNYCIRMVDTNGIINTVAGTSYYGFSGDGGPAVDAQLSVPYGIKVDSAGDIFIADHENNRIRLVGKDGIINTIAGDGTAGFSGDGGPATNAMLNYPTGVAYDGSGHLFIADEDNYRIRKTTLTTLAVPRVNKSMANIFTYPNPTKGFVTIVNAANCTYAVDDILGRTIMSGAITNSRETIDATNLASGVYLLQVANSNVENKTMKITKD